MPRKLSINEVKKQIKNKHGDDILLDETTYVNTHTKARFIDKDYGEWWATPNNITRGHGHKERSEEKSRQTCVSKYGFNYPIQSPEIQKKLRETYDKKYCDVRIKCKCNKCDKEFYLIQSLVDRGGGKFCSRECRKNKIGRECQWCKKEFVVIQSIIDKGAGKFCSTKCYGNWQSKNKTIDRNSSFLWKSNKIKRKCQRCEKIFYISKRQGKIGEGKFCSRKCCKSRIIKNCKQCDKEFSIIPSRIKKGEGKFCGKICYGHWRSKNIRGDKHRWWKGGCDKEYRIVYCPEEYRPMSQANGQILEHRLKVAQAIGRCLTREEVVHHVDENKLNNNLNNLWLFRNDSEHLSFHWGSKSVSPIWKSN